VPRERMRNAVLEQLAEADPAVFAGFSSELEPVSLQQGAVLGPIRMHTQWTYFLESGIVALVASTDSGASVEVAVVGREGVAGIADALGRQPLPYQLIVQLPGTAHRVRKNIVRDHIMSCSALHELLMDDSQRLMHQLAQSALCNRFHTGVQRLSRWLLATADRAETSRFELTHEFVARMVGAPRSVVSEAAAALRSKGIIDYRRGVLTIRQPKRLQGMSCECFQALPTMSADDPVGRAE
jgi:CRP-like cAMP-binding protein